MYGYSQAMYRDAIFAAVIFTIQVKTHLQVMQRVYLTIQ